MANDYGIDSAAQAERAHYATEACTVERETSAHERAQLGLSSEMGMLHDTLSELASRLRPVLVDRPEKGSVPCEARDSAVANATRFLYEMTDRVQQARSQVQELLHTLDV